MGNKVIICGGNGAGKSTLGEYLARQIGYQFMDIEDYFFPQKAAGAPYENGRTLEEATKFLLADIKKYDNFILASVKGDYGSEVESAFTHAIIIDAPKALRLTRVRERSFQEFGERVLPCGDLYESEQQFFDKVERRSIKDVEDWLQRVHIPTIKVDGTKAVEYNAEIMKRWLSGSEDDNSQFVISLV